MGRFLALFLALAASAFATDYTSDGSLSNSQALYNGMVAGDRLFIGPVTGGTYVWTGPLVCGTAGTTVWGGGAGVAPNFSDTATTGAFTNLTTIQQGGAVALFQLNANGITLGGFIINGETSIGSNGMIQVNNDWCHVRNIYYNKCAGTPPIVAKLVTFNHVYGEVDHITDDDTNNTGAGQNGEDVYGTGHTDAWTNPINAGNAGLVTDYFGNSVPQQVVIENCLWHQYTGCAVEFDGNGRFTVRHCVMDNDGSKVDMHGLSTNGAPSRGGRLAEVYSNAWTNATNDFNIRTAMRGGTFYWYNNTNAALGSNGGFQVCDYSYIDVLLFPNFDIPISSISTSGVVTTSAPHLLGPNGTTFTTSAGIQVYSTTATASPTFVAGTNLGAVCAMTVLSPTTLQLSGVTVSVAGTSGFLLYQQTPYQYPILDQVGKGADIGGVAFSGPAAGNPAYSWRNTQGAGLSTRKFTVQTGAPALAALNLYNAITSISSFNDNDVAQQDRDWFTDLTVNGGAIGGPGTGSTGVGVGLLSQRPASPTKVNAGYWATDTSTLYTVSSGLSWVANYQPWPQYPYIQAGITQTVGLSAYTINAVHL